MVRIFAFLSFAVLFPVILPAQSISIGSVADKFLRLQQLNGQLDPSISFTVRPLSVGNIIDSGGSTTNARFASLYNTKVQKFFTSGRLSLLPVSLAQQFNSHHPYGWNDGGMIAAKGYQTMMSAGVFAALGPLEIQVQPEFVFAANPSYERTGLYGNTGSSYAQIFPGQSKIALNFFSLTAGVSTQNLWWGPGIHSSLLMSNNAPGFLHGFVGSQHPLKTPIGSFEWQLIGAKLTANATGYENFHLLTQTFRGARYLNAYVLSYQPKWIKGLFVGMTRGLQRYRADIDKSGTSLINKYIPVLTKALQKENAQADDTMRTDQLASFFMRWHLPKAKTEFYIEYGFNDYNQNVRDYLMGPTHSAAYIVGAKKIVELGGSRYLDLGLEMTQMSQSPEAMVREAGNWYTHGQISEGYTNENQIIGAGAGLGTNVQTFTATWIDGIKQLGIILERVDRDPQYHTFKWVDFSFGILPQWQRGKMILSGKLQFIHSSQYAWQKDINRFNLHSRLAVQYLF